jgi:hypothetical protein
LLDLTEVKDFVRDTMGILEPTLGNATLNGHLASLVSHFVFETRTALSTFGSFGGGSSVSGTISTTDTLCFVSSSFCGL